MKQVFAEEIGDAKIVIAKVEGGFQGLVWRKGQRSQPIVHDNLEALKAQLRNEAGRLHPDYVGIEGAKARFRRYFPEGFADPYYATQERNYKDKARAALLEAAPLDAALQADSELALACRKALGTNLLSRFEAARLSELLGSAQGPAFVRAAAAFTRDPNQASLDAMERAVAAHGRASWPIVTYLPFLWQPERHMFLKPEATVDFATRIGHWFAREYASTLAADVYSGLLDLAASTERDIAGLLPHDRIDVQSFIWVVGSYTDEQLPDPVSASI